MTFGSSIQLALNIGPHWPRVIGPLARPSLVEAAATDKTGKRSGPLGSKRHIHRKIDALLTCFRTPSDADGRPSSSVFAEQAELKYF